MVCRRCIIAVQSELNNIGTHWISIELGEVETLENISSANLAIFRENLKKSGLILIDDRKSILVESVKTLIIKLIHHTDHQLKINLSDYLSEHTQHNYTYLSNLFSEVKGTTIEKFYLAHKIERAKELLVYDELNLTQIAEKLHYSSVAHLSNQFKKMTGLTPSHFKNLRHKRRFMLEDL
jgi:AraC-like DNA-binding protein